MQYFSTWTGFVITILLCLDCFHEHMKRRAERRAENPPKKKKSRRHWMRKSEEEPKKDKSVPPAQPQPVMQSARGSSMRSSLDTDEFCDARDDLDLKL